MPWENQARDSCCLDKAVVSFPRSHLSLSTPKHFCLFVCFEFLAAEYVLSCEIQRQKLYPAASANILPLTKEAFTVEASALEDKGQFHIASSDISELRDVNEAASCCSQATAPITKYSTLCM